MGWFKKRRKKGMESEIKSEQTITYPSDKKKSLKDACDQILICDKKAQDAKIEYEAVTSYLTDMQRIDLVPLAQRLPIEDAARNIINLTKERKKFQNRKREISDQQYAVMEQYETTIPDFIPKLQKEEEFKVLVEEDIKKVEEEKERIEEEQNDTIEKQQALKHLTIGIGIVVLFLFLLFMVLQTMLQADMKLPFTLSGIFVFFVAVVILNESYKNQCNMKRIESMRRRAVYLYNKLAIKEVNSRNYLEYSYNKYLVQNAAELKKLFEEYIELKDEARRYQSNTELLNYFQTQLIDALNEAGVTDSEIWIYQAEALLDHKEMVEVRHRLNIRRQKLRDIIDNNTKLRNNLLDEMKSTVEQYPALSIEMQNFVEWYQNRKN